MAGRERDLEEKTRAAFRREAMCIDKRRSGLKDALSRWDFVNTAPGRRH